MTDANSYYIDRMNEKHDQVKRICENLRDVSGPLLFAKAGEVKKAIDLVVEIQGELITEMEVMKCHLKTLR